MSDIVFALPKGRLAERVIEVLEKCDIDCRFLKFDTRELVLTDSNKQYKFIFVKPSDVPTYVERGAADVGVAGKDTILEQNKDIYELIDLKFGKCRMCVAGFENDKKTSYGNLKVATKYERIAREFYESKGVNVDIIKLNGSVELGPIVGLSDVIVDIVESGATLKANGLTVLEEIFSLSARLVVNKVSLKTKSERILPLVKKISEAIV
jgi:ATP phosphoribosyltransferase